MQFPGITLTHLGANLLAKAQTGVQLVYTIGGVHVLSVNIVMITSRR